MNEARVVNNREIRYTLTEYLHFIKCASMQMTCWGGDEACLFGTCLCRSYFAQSSDSVRTEQRQYVSLVKPLHTWTNATCMSNLRHVWGLSTSRSDR